MLQDWNLLRCEMPEGFGRFAKGGKSKDAPKASSASEPKKELPEPSEEPQKEAAKKSEDQDQPEKKNRSTGEDSYWQKIIKLQFGLAFFNYCSVKMVSKYSKKVMISRVFEMSD